MHVNFGHLIPRVCRTPRGVGRLSMLILGRLWVSGVVLNMLTLEELHHSLELLGYGSLEVIVHGE
jgi:hypothetical protein